MTYREIYVNNPSFWEKHSPESNCLVWSNNLEHAVFSIDDKIHLCSRFVWIKPQNTSFILCYEYRIQGNAWVFVELKLGKIPLENNNPFDGVPSVFPQNGDEQWKRQS